MTSRENWKRFCETVPTISLNYMEWCNILYTFNYNFRDHILETGDRTKLPWGLGDFTIMKKRPRRIRINKNGEEKIALPVDWQKTMELGKRVYHLNNHTEGFRFGWKWLVYTARFYKANIWNFKASRVSSRLIKHYISKGHQHIYREWNLMY